ncbi:MAG: DUF4397 domain-containing protein [Gemmatimonadaceae bacterium]|jgi:hypothetical protein|nr:DUF4397 domain-containing protein [Gemmatimonadaceae bacterium]
MALPRPSRVAVATSALFAVVACGDLTRDDATAPSTGSARVRVVHVSPDAPAVNVSRAGATLAQGVAFAAPAPQSGYVTTPAGQGVLEIAAATGGAAVYRNNIPLARDSAYTVVALGNVAGGFAAGAARTFQPVVLRDTVATPTAGGWLRLVHAVDSVGLNTATPPAVVSAVDFYVYPQGGQRPTAAPAAGTAIRVVNASFRAVTAYLPLATAGTYVVEVYAAGAAPATATPLVNTTVAITNGLKATVVVRRPQVGATAAPLNAHGLVVLPET